MNLPNILHTFKLVLLFVPLSFGTGLATTTDRNTCEAAIDELGFRDLEYSFEEGGILNSDVHKFGKVRCIVGSTSEIERIDIGNVVLAEDGVIGPHLLLLREAVVQSSKELRQLAKEKRKQSVDLAQREFEQKKLAAHKREDERLLAIEQSRNDALEAIALGNPRPEILAAMDVDSTDPIFSAMDASALSELLSDADLSETWSDKTKGYLEEAKIAAIVAYSNPSKLADDLKSQGLILIDKAKDSAKSTYEVVSLKTGETYELIMGAEICNAIEVLNGEAISYVGGMASGFASAAAVAKPSKSRLMVTNLYREVIVIKGVGFLSRSASSGFITTTVVPAIPTATAGLAGASAVVYLGTMGVCYVTSPEAKEHLEAAQSFSFSALDIAKERAEAIIQYVRN